MAWSKVEQISVDDGSFDLKVVLPSSGAGPGILVLQEIFGVNSYVEDVCHRLAEFGLVAAAPDVFWRMRPGVSLEGRDPETIAEALDYGKRIDIEQAVADLRASLATLRAMPEVLDKAGVIGFCLGGTLAYLLAAEADCDLCISYYGAGVPSQVGRMDDIASPLLIVFGGADPVISSERVERVRQAAAGRPNVLVHVAEGAGHAFDNHTDPAGYHARAAADVWALSQRYLRVLFAPDNDR